MIFHNFFQGFKFLDDVTIILEVNNKLSTVLVDMDKYCNYSVRVTAMTSIGTGPWSESVTCITAEDGKSLLKLHFPAVQCHRWVYDEQLSKLSNSPKTI